MKQDAELIKRMTVTISEAKPVYSINLLDNLNKDIPSWAKYIAVDDDGRIYAYEYEPVNESECWYWPDNDSAEKRLDEIGRLQFEPDNWRELLIELPEKEKSLSVGDIVVFDIYKLTNTKVSIHQYYPAVIREIRTGPEDGYKYVCSAIRPADHHKATFYVDPREIVKAISSITGEELEIV